MDSYTDWSAVLPKSVALAQLKWERRRAIMRMIDCGLTNKEIARRLGRASSTAQLWREAITFWKENPSRSRANRPSPFKLYCSQSGDIAAMAAKLGPDLRYQRPARGSRQGRLPDVPRQEYVLEHDENGPAMVLRWVTRSSWPYPDDKLNSVRDRVEAD